MLIQVIRSGSVITTDHIGCQVGDCDHYRSHRVSVQGVESLQFKWDVRSGCVITTAHTGCPVGVWNHYSSHSVSGQGV